MGISRTTVRLDTIKVILYPRITETYWRTAMATLKTYYEDGIAKRFYKEAYSRSVILEAQKTGKNISEVEQIIADQVCKNTNTVHGWRFESNGGPSDIETVKDLGKMLCGNPNAFLTTVLEGKTMTKLTDRQLDAFKRIYDEAKKFILDYYDTNGFCDYKEEEEKSSMDVLPDSATNEDFASAIMEAEGKAQDRAWNHLRHVLFVLEQEYFDLHGTELYDELWNLLQSMNELWLNMKPVREVIEIEGEELGEVFIGGERMNRFEKELKALVERYN